MYYCNYINGFIRDNLIVLEKLNINNACSFYVYYYRSNASYIFRIGYREYLSKDYYYNFFLISDLELQSIFNEILSYYRKNIREILTYLPRNLSDIVFNYLI